MDNKEKIAKVLLLIAIGMATLNILMKIFM
nr:MAG TPA: hypothetical protein [Caudoviricetes sp.]